MLAQFGGVEAFQRVFAWLQHTRFAIGERGGNRHVPKREHLPLGDSGFRALGRDGLHSSSLRTERSAVEGHGECAGIAVRRGEDTGIEPGCVRTGQRYRSDILPFIVRGSTPVAFQGIGCGALQLELHLVAEAGTNMRCFLIDVAIGIGIVLHVNAAWAGK